MPIDLNNLRKEKGGDPDKVREYQKKRFANVDLVDQTIALDALHREKQSACETLRMEMNALQLEISKLFKDKSKREEAQVLVAKRKVLAESEPALKQEADALKRQVDKTLAQIGNIVDPSVPVSQNEDENVIVSTWGTPKVDESKTFSFHHDLLHRIDGYEPDRGVNVAGHKGYFLKGVGVMLNQALIAYSQSFLCAKKFTLLQPPYFMSKDMMSGIAQLEDFDEQLYKVMDGEEERYLIATSEQPICGYHKGDWIEESELPIRYGGTSTCFRKEAGSHGRDVWGIFRVHQFEKVEQFCITAPEDSAAMQEEMIATAEEFYQSLGLPYRVVNIVSGELNNAAIKKYDLEAWFPGYKEFRELVSSSNCTDYQSRAMEIRCGTKKMNQTEKRYVHMLNSTLCATTRTLCCILENYQEDNGVRVPACLVPFMGGMTFMPFVNEVKVNINQLKMERAAEKKGKKKN